LNASGKIGQSLAHPGAISMAAMQSRYSKEEFTRCLRVHSQVEMKNHGKTMAINIETGKFEVVNDAITVY
jgi:hypothetical protein